MTNNKYVKMALPTKAAAIIWTLEREYPSNQSVFGSDGITNRKNRVRIPSVTAKLRNTPSVFFMEKN